MIRGGDQITARGPPMLDKLRNRITSASRDGSLQERVDAVSNLYRRARESDVASDFRSRTQSETVRGAHPPGDMLSSVLPGLGHLKGLVTQVQSGGGLLRAVNQLARDLPSANRAAAIQQAINGLSGASRQDLSARLGRQGNDPAAAVIGILEQGGGFEQVLRRLSRGHPAAGALNLIETLKDPVIQEFARSLIPALVKAKGAGVPPPDAGS